MSEDTAFQSDETVVILVFDDGVLVVRGFTLSAAHTSVLAVFG